MTPIQTSQAVTVKGPLRDLSSSIKAKDSSVSIIKTALESFGKTNFARALGYKDGRSWKDFALSFISPKAGAEWLDAVKAVVVGMGSCKTNAVMVKEMTDKVKNITTKASKNFADSVANTTKGAEDYKAAKVLKQLKGLDNTVKIAERRTADAAAKASELAGLEHELNTAKRNLKLAPGATLYGKSEAQEIIGAEIERLTAEIAKLKGE